MRKPILLEHNHWISIEEIEVLDHGLNWSNWVDTYPCKGRWEIELCKSDDSIFEIKIFMPASEWNQKNHHGFWRVYYGRIEFTNTKLFIWQNEDVPVSIHYYEIESEIELTIFKRKIRFRKKTHE
ncbi:hypothetical protein [Tenacibaculum jejuense]|uniref:Uncharacterized protein n=1 Tax=Tenacibaculum jejuense TaxID=584609 RepID=A0A238U4M5_9FLAO|nr:hypothetical protein [Tenacibaculum jejuense]SNR14151.1 protein of unknown function [Tenacibaculum jejuense]